MPTSHFSLISTNPWRMLLFGVLGCLLPIAIYIVSWELMNSDLHERYNYLYKLLLFPSIILGGVLTYAGYKLSSYKIEIEIDENGLREKITPLFFLLPKRNISTSWKEIASHSFTEDSKGKVLIIHLKNHRKLTIAQAYIINSSHDFDAFYKNFLSNIETYNNLNIDEEQVQAMPGFYQSKWGKFFAYILILLFLTVAFVPAFMGIHLNFWGGFRLCFFGMVTGLYVYRSLFTNQ